MADIVFKLAAGTLTQAQMALRPPIENWPLQTPTWADSGAFSRISEWFPPQRDGTFFQRFEVRSRALSGTYTLKGLATARWNLGFLTYAKLDYLHTTIWGAGEYGTAIVTMQMPTTEFGDETNMLIYNGLAIWPWPEDTLTRTGNGTNRGNVTVIQFINLTEAS